MPNQFAIPTISEILEDQRRRSRRATGIPLRRTKAYQVAQTGMTPVADIPPTEKAPEQPPPAQGQQPQQQPQQPPIPQQPQPQQQAPNLYTPQMDTPQPQGMPVQAPKGIQAPDSADYDRLVSKLEELEGPSYPRSDQYKAPGLGRRIASYAIGGLMGIGDPLRGYEIGSEIYHAPFQKAKRERDEEIARIKDVLAARRAQYEAKDKTSLNIASEQLKMAQADEAKAKKDQLEENVQNSLWKRGPQGRAFILQQIEAKNLNKENVFDMQYPNGMWTSVSVDRDEKGNRIVTDLFSGDLIDERSQGRLFKVGPELKPIVVGKESAVLDPYTLKETYVGQDLPKALSEQEKIHLRGVEWDRRNKIQHDQRLEMAKISLQNSISRLKMSDALITARPTARTKDRAAISADIQDQVPAIKAQIYNIAEKLGPGAGRWNDFWVNKLGANDPEFSKLDSLLQLYSLAIMNAHLGRSGSVKIVDDIRKEFSEAQSPENLLARIDGAEAWIDDYAKLRRIPIVGEEAPGPALGVPKTPKVANPNDPMDILGGRK